MEIKAVKFRKDGFYTQPFIFGGEDGAEKYDKNIRYRGSLQNYLIDTGDEVILVDTGIPAGTPEEVPDENSPRKSSTRREPHRRKIRSERQGECSYCFFISDCEKAKTGSKK